MYEEKFYIDSSDEDILETFESWLKESTTYHDEMLRSQKISEEYYKGNQTNKGQLPTHEPDTVENRIFEATETLVPIATANAHQFTVMPGNENERSLAKAEKLQKILTKKYQSLELQEKLEDITRDLILFRFGVAKYVWSEILDDVDVEVIDPRLILIPKLRSDPHELPYVMEIQEYSYNEMSEYFPKVDIDELSPEGASANKTGQGSSEYDRKTYKVHEVWTNEMVAWICDKEVLEKRANPYWDFEGETKHEPIAIAPDGKLKKKKRLIFRNHLDRPEKPFVFFTTFNVSDGPVSPVSLAEVAIPMQDDINKQKRLIVHNLKQMGSGQVLLDSDAMTEEEAGNITNEPGLVVRGEGIASQSKMRREPGVPLPQSHFANLQHSEATFDNLMGTHTATRGQAQAKTLGQDILSRQQDFTRIDLITRVLNRGVSRLANGLVQLMRLYYTESHVVKILGKDGAIEFVSLNRDDIEDHIEIDVKDGNTLPMDEVTLRTEAVQLWQLQAIDPVTLFERLKFANPEKSAQRLLAWKQGQLTMETQAKIQQDQAATQTKLQADMQMAQVTGKGMSGAPAPTSSAPAKGRGVETPLNVMQRATANLGGTAPVAAGTPNQ